MGRRWLVTGSTGQLGGHVLQQLAAQLRDDDTVLTVGRPGSAPRADVALDLADSGRLSALLAEHRPTHIVHLAGMSSPRAVEAEPRRARLLNVSVTIDIAAHAQRCGACMLFPSSDWAFDGTAERRLTEVDAPRPQTTYGRYKVEAEGAVLAVPLGVVLRLPLLCGLPTTAGTRSTWLLLRQQLLEGRAVEAVTDEHRTPLSLSDAASAVVALVVAGAAGLFHAAGPEVLTPHDVILSLAASVGGEHLVLPRSRAELGRGVDRPRSVALDGARLAAALPHLVPRRIDASTFASDGGSTTAAHR